MWSDDEAPKWASCQQVLPAALRSSVWGRAAEIPTGPKHTHIHLLPFQSPALHIDDSSSSGSQAIFIFNYVVSERQLSKQRRSRRRKKKLNCGMHNVPGSPENWATLKSLLQLGGHRRWRIETATCRNANESICQNVKRFASIEYLARGCNQSSTRLRNANDLCASRALFRTSKKTTYEGAQMGDTFFSLCTAVLRILCSILFCANSRIYSKTENILK